MILVDYTCRACGRGQEQWVAGSVPSASVCPGCGDESRRRWSPIGLGGRAQPAPAGRPAGAQRTLCQQYPQIPALCHMSESAGRMWVAKYNKDNRTIETELARQETRAKQRLPVLADAITHSHQSAPALATQAAPTE